LIGSILEAREQGCRFLEQRPGFFVSLQSEQDIAERTQRLDEPIGMVSAPTELDRLTISL
jgi:hypothetical protein